ncbi:MAG TPA: thiamine phosphate synthase [Vicinamibacteria bacterium]|nr:thiamine phosphate synthase [Vicinamibacteria bacterium]
MVTGDAADQLLMEQIGRALEFGVDLVQIRRKTETARELQSLVVAVLNAFPEARERILVNDRLDVALAAGAGGVHLPASGLPTGSVRELAPPGFLVARSVHNPNEAIRAAREGASFVVFGPIYSTLSKPGHPGTGVEGLREVVECASVEVFAIGGIDARRASEVAGTGAAGVAGISVFRSADALAELMTRLGELRGSLP